MDVLGESRRRGCGDYRLWAAAGQSESVSRDRQQAKHGAVVKMPQMVSAESLRAITVMNPRDINSPPANLRQMETGLLTQRLLLRPWTMDDHAAFLAIVQDPAVMRYIGPGVTWNAQQVTEFIGRQLELQGQHGFCMWAVCLRECGTLVGFCGGRPWSETEVEIGWRLAQSCWGQGYATEAARCAVQYLQEVCGATRLIAHAQLANTGSIRVMEKLGMRSEGLREKHGNTVVQYALGREAPVL